jgi:hypothetical protein
MDDSPYAFRTYGTRVIVSGTHRHTERMERGRVPLNARDYLAGYAAVVATAALGWQIWSNYRAKRPQVTLLLDAWRSKQASGRKSLDDVEVRIRNREEYAVRVERLYFHHRFPTSLFGHPIPADIEAGDISGLPFEVPARDVISLTLRPSRTYKFSTSGAFGPEPTPEIRMELRTGERYGSRPSRQTSG